jgi:hypothetical protein
MIKRNVNVLACNIDDEDDNSNNNSNHDYILALLYCFFRIFGMRYSSDYTVNSFITFIVRRSEFHESSEEVHFSRFFSIIFYSLTSNIRVHTGN